ncbi:unnamed protein product [Effrenium voratum]|nr:unnamed protein product [Effrenium voratum]
MPRDAARCAQSSASKVRNLRNLVDNFSPSLGGITSAIRASRGWREVAALLAVLEDVGLRADTVVYNAAMTACNRAGHWQQALALMDTLEARSLQADLITFSVAIGASSKATQWQVALQLLSRLESTGMRADLWIYSAAIGACGRGEQWWQAVALLARMQQEELEADVVAYSTTLSSCASAHQWQRALGYMAEMTKEGLQPDVIAYNSAMNALTKGNCWEQVLGLLGSLESQGVRADGFTTTAAISATQIASWRSALLVALPSSFSTESLNALLSSCGSTLRWQQSLSMFELSRLWRVPADQISANTLTACQARWQQSAWLLQWLERAKLEPNVRAYTAASTASALDDTKRGVWAHSLQLIGAGRLRASEDSVLRTSAAKALETVGRWQQGLQLLESDFDESVAASAAAMGSWGRGQHWEVVLRRLDAGTSHLSAWNAGIAGCARAEQWQVALQLLCRLEGTCMRADLWTYSAAIGACGRGEQWRQAVALLARMRQEKLEADVVAYSATLSSCASAHQWQRALGYMEEMTKEAMKADVIAYNSAMSALVKGNRWQHALQLFSGLSAGEVSLDKASFQLLLGEFLK